MILPVLDAIARVARDTPPRTTWQIKVGTHCNLRCRYCYEWDRLGDRGRLSLEQWRHVFEAIRAHRIHRVREMGRDVVTTIVWHGGEPTLHPPAYVRAVLDLQRDVLGELTTGPECVRNAVQTNLMSIGETLSLMVEAGFVVSVSTDFAPGVRVDARGRDTDTRVCSNLERLLACGTTCGVALVLGQHNGQRLEQVYDVVECMGAAWLNIIPMFRPPVAAPGADLLLDPIEVVNVLERLFVHWISHGARMPVHPLGRVLRTVFRASAAFQAESDSADRRVVRLIVQPDGTLQEQIGAAFRSVSLGNVFTHSFDEILHAPEWEAARHERNSLRARHCLSCAYHRTCDGKAVLDAPHTLAEGPCPVESALCARVERHLERAGIVAVDEAVW